MTTTISQFAVSATGLATWLNPGAPTGILVLSDNTTGWSVQLTPTAVSCQLPVGVWTAGDLIVLQRVQNTFSATIPPSPVPAPTVIADPVVSGTFTVGGVLTVTEGTWSNATSFAVQWYRATATNTPGTAVLAATKGAYTLQAADAGSYVYPVVTVTGPGGPSVYTVWTSTVVAAVTPPPASAYVVTPPQYMVAPSGGSWQPAPVLGDAFNPANGLDATLWYPASAGPQTTSANTAAFYESGQVTIDPSGKGLALTNTRQSSAISHGGKSFNYLTGQVDTFPSDVGVDRWANLQAGAGRNPSVASDVGFLMNPTTGNAWCVCWDMLLPVNTDPSGSNVLGGLDMGIWFFDDQGWTILEIDDCELFGSGTGTAAYGPNEVFTPPSSGANWEQGQSALVYDHTAFHRWEAMIDNVNKQISLKIDGTLITPTSWNAAAWSNAAAKNVMCGFALSNDMRATGTNSTSSPTWTGSRTVYIKDVSIWTTATNPGTYQGGGVAPGTTIA